MILFVNTLACGRGSKGFDNILISSLCILLLGKDYEQQLKERPLRNGPVSDYCSKSSGKG